MPADLGGDIYVHLERGKSIDTIASQLRDFAERIKEQA